MRNKRAKQFRKLSKTSDGKLNMRVYRNMKKQWNRLSKPEKELYGKRIEYAANSKRNI